MGVSAKGCRGDGVEGFDQLPLLEMRLASVSTTAGTELIVGEQVTTTAAPLGLEKAPDSSSNIDDYLTVEDDKIVVENDGVVQVSGVIYADGLRSNGGNVNQGDRAIHDLAVHRIRGSSTTVYRANAVYTRRGLPSGARGGTLSFNVSFRVEADDEIQFLLDAFLTQTQGALTLQASRLSALWCGPLVAAGSGSDGGGGSMGTSGDAGAVMAGRAVQQHLVAYGRFLDSELVNGLPPDAPFQFADGSGASFSSTGSGWTFDPAANFLADDSLGGLWRTEASAHYLFGAWYVGAQSKERVSPGATLFATDSAGTGASETPPDGWTHFGLRRLNGDVVWVPRATTPLTKDLIFNLTNNFSAAGDYKHLVNPHRNLDNFQFLEIAFLTFNSSWEPNWETSILVPVDRLITAPEITGLYSMHEDRSLRVWAGSEDGGGNERLSHWEILPDASGYTYTSLGWGFRQTVRFEHDAADLPTRMLRSVGFRGGGIGSGNIKMYLIP